VAGVLRDIRIRTPSVTVLSTGNLSRVLVRWELEPTSQDLRNLRFFVDRGESPTEMKPLHAPGISASQAREFIDLSANLLDLEKVYYYRVRAVEFSGTSELQTFSSIAATWDGTPDLVALYVIEEALFAHRYIYGVPTMIFKKRHDGTYCPDCWDSILKRVTRSNCETCYGTGKLGGFYPPSESWMGFEADPKNEMVADWGRKQDSQTDIQFTNYPVLSVDDVIVELKMNRIWKIVNVRTVEKNRTVVLQIARVSAVNPTDVEYKVPVSEERRMALLAEMDKRELEREF
jgi:hypothetical protein